MNKPTMTQAQKKEACREYAKKYNLTIKSVCSSPSLRCKAIGEWLDIWRR